MRKLWQPAILAACFAIALVQFAGTEAYFRGWLNEDLGLGVWIAGGVGAIPMVILFGAGPGGGTSRLGWAVLITINTFVYYAIALLFRESRANRHLRRRQPAAPFS